MVCLAAPTAALAQQHAATQEHKEGINLKEILFGHVQDAYQWHITDIGEHPVVLHLPMIFYSKHSGWHVLLSSQFQHHAGPDSLRAGEGKAQGFYIKGANDEKGKIVEDVNGELVPVSFDISITKTVLVLFIDALLLLLCILTAARWCRRNKPDSPAPKGFVGLVHMTVMMVYNDMIRPALGKETDKYAPYLLTCFFFIFTCNVMGLIPFPPGSGNVTGNIAVTFFLALCTFIIVQFSGNKHYWKDIFWPDVPTWLKCPAPIIPIIEFVGIFTKPFALMIRLFANMMAGHAIAVAITCIIFLVASQAVAVQLSMSGLSVLMSIFMMCLECLVCFIQAMVFTMLSAVFIGLARVEPAHE